MKIIKDFDLLSPKWLDIIFEKRNRQYGAYELRNDSSNRHIKALIIVFVIGLLGIFLPKIVSSIEWGEQDVAQDTAVSMVDLKTEEEKQPEEQQVQQEDVPPPPILKKSIQVTQIKIDDDEKATADKIETQNQLAEIEAEIAAETVKDGVTDGTGINKDDIKQIIVPKVDSVYQFVDKAAEFPGGEKELMEWLNKNIKYPASALENGAQGKVFVSFIVRTDGRIDNVKIARGGAHPSLNNEAMRLVREMPRWKAGQRNGQSVSSLFTLPVTFLLQ